MAQTPAERIKAYRLRRKLGIKLPWCGQCGEHRLYGETSKETGVCGYCRNKNTSTERSKKSRRNQAMSMDFHRMKMAISILNESVNDGSEIMWLSKPVANAIVDAAQYAQQKVTEKTKLTAMIHASALMLYKHGASVMPQVKDAIDKALDRD